MSTWANPDGTPHGERLDKLEALVKQTAANLLELRKRFDAAQNPPEELETDTSEPEIPKIPRRRRQRPKRSE